MKPHPEDIIWNTVTASARNRFDYTAFKKQFGPFSNDRVLDTVLFQILEGCAEGKPAAEIGGNLSHDLQMLNYAFADMDFEPFVAEHTDLFKKEIDATAIALKAFCEEKEIDEILKTIESVLDADDQ